MTANIATDFSMIEHEQEKKQMASAKAQESKEVAQIQACIAMATQIPRNENQAYLDIMASCKRPTLAEKAQYAFPRGGKLVKGPSIRLAEVLAQKYGNMLVEMNITSQTAEKTEAIATAIDLQTKYIVSQSFVVEHKRTTKNGVKRITDERDVREMVNNIGSRILRNCILRVIPPDITEAAIQQCEKTLVTSDVPIKEQIQRMTAAFDEQGVKIEHLEKRLGHNLDATVPEEIVTLKSIYRSIKDGMAKREDFFEIGKAESVQEATETLADVLKNKKVDLKTGEFENEKEKKK